MCPKLQHASTPQKAKIAKGTVEPRFAISDVAYVMLGFQYQAKATIEKNKGNIFMTVPEA